MSMDLTGINNQNEYYTNHYFASIFEENAEETLQRWREETSQSGDKTPWAKLGATSARYFTLRDQASRMRSEVLLKPVVTKLAKDVLASLGYPIGPNTAKRIEAAPGVFIPVALEMTKHNGAPLLWVILCCNGGEDDDILGGARFFTSWEGYDNEETGYCPGKKYAEIYKTITEADSPESLLSALSDRVNPLPTALIVAKKDNVEEKDEDDIYQNYLHYFRENKFLEGENEN